MLTEVLHWLWNSAAGPVLEALGHHRQPSADDHATLRRSLTHPATATHDPAANEL